MSMIYSLRSQGYWADARGTNLLDTGAPFYDTFETADGKYISIGSVEPHFYQRMIQLIGLGSVPEMAVQNDPRRWAQQKPMIAAAILTRTRDEWCAILEGTDACFAPVLSLDEAPRHKHNVARDAFVEVAGAMQPAPAPRFSRTEPGVPQPMTVGADVTAALLRDIGISEMDILRLRHENIAA